MTTLEVLVRTIGISHLLQPPLTLVLSRTLGLRDAFSQLAELPRRMAVVMGMTCVALPTGMGVLIAAYAAGVFRPGLPETLCVLAGVFWTLRLLVQVFWYSALFPRDARHWHWILCLIFAVQGPGLLVVVGTG